MMKPLRATFESMAAEGQPGEIVTARVRNPLENARCTGKARPVILVRRDGCVWYVMGLTTKPTYNDRTARRVVPRPDAVGLSNRRPSYLWADHLTRVAVLDIDKHIGWVDNDLARTIIEHARLSGYDAAQLMFATTARTR